MQLHPSFVSRSRHNKARESAAAPRPNFSAKLTPALIVKITQAAISTIERHNSEFGTAVNSVIDSLDSHQPPWTISQVCRAWRQATVGVPVLWSTIAVDLDRTHNAPGSPRYDRLCLMLQRSADCSLTLVVLNREARLPNSRDPLLDLLMQHSRRWFSLDLAIKGNLIPSMTPIHGKLSRIQKLSVKHTEPHSAKDDSAFTPFESFELAPMLTDVTQYAFQHIVRTFALPWPQIKTYTTFFADYRDCLQIMKESANTMERCNYEENSAAEGRPPLGMVEMIEMRKLSHFRLDLNAGTLDRMAADLPRFFNALSFPVIEEMRLSWAPHIPFHPSVGKMLRRTNVRIRVLDLEIQISPWELIDAIQHMVYLSKLGLYWYDEEMITEMGYRFGGTIAPSLTHFQLECPSKLDALEDMIKSRQNPPPADPRKPARPISVILLVKRYTNKYLKFRPMMRKMMKEWPGFDIRIAETGYFGSRIPDASEWGLLGDPAMEEDWDDDYLKKIGTSGVPTSQGEGSGKGTGRSYQEDSDDDSEGSYSDGTDDGYSDDMDVDQR